MNTKNGRQIGQCLASCAIAAISFGLFFATGCTSNAYKTAVVQEPVTIYPLTGTTVGTGETATIAATTGVGGVTWSLSGSGCSGSACGTLAGATASSVEYVAPATLSGGSLSVTLTATSVSTPSLNASITLTVVPVAVTITPPASTVVNPGASVTLTAAVSNDSSGDGVTWSLSGTGCTGAACGALTNVTKTSVTYTAPITFTSLAISVTATSVAVPGDSASQALSVPAAGPISVTIAPPTSTVVNDGASLALTAVVTNDVGNDGVVWSLSGTGCSGTTCGALTNVTSTSVTYTAPLLPASALAVTITATSVANSAASATLGLTVPAQAASLTITPALLPAAVAGQAYTETIQVSGGVAPYTFTPTNLPAWVTVTPAADSVTLTGTPASTDVGTFNAEFSVTDSTAPTPLTGAAYLPLTTYSAVAASNSMLTGSYAFYGSGWQDGSTIAATQRIGYIGSFTADGAGNITGGELDVNNSVGLTSYTGLTGTYNVQANQTGTVTLILPSGVLPITLAVGLGGLNGSNVATTGRFAEYDDSTGVTAALTANSSGIRIGGALAQQSTAVLSTKTSPISGSYAFGMAGGNPSSALTSACESANTCGPVSSAGAITFVSGGAISTGEEDVAVGSTTANEVAISGALGNSGNTDASGRLTATLTASNASLLDWPADYVIYVVSPTMFYAMSSDSYATNSLLSGEAMQQNLSDIAAAPFSGTDSVVLYGNGLGAAFIGTPTGGQTLAEIALLTPAITNPTTGTISGMLDTNNQGVLAKTAVSGITYTVIPGTGRVTLAGSSVSLPELYLVDTDEGFATQQPSDDTETAAVFQFQPQTGTPLNAGNYVLAAYSNPNPIAPVDAGIWTLPSGGLPNTGTSVTYTGQFAASYAEKSDAYSAGAVLVDKAITGPIIDTNGLLSGMSINTGFQFCGTSGVGYVISTTEFVCFSGSTSVKYNQVVIGQQ